MYDLRGWINNISDIEEEEEEEEEEERELSKEPVEQSTPIDTRNSKLVAKPRQKWSYVRSHRP